MNCLLERETFIVVHEIFGVRSEGKVYAFSHAFDERIKIELMKCISRQKLQSTTTTCLGKKCIWATGRGRLSMKKKDNMSTVRRQGSAGG